MEASSSTVRTTVFTALFTALISIGAYLAIPIGPVPIVLQNFFVLLTGVLLGKYRGLSVVMTYLILGALGLPVFHSGTGGLGIIMGPTGGYLIGYVPAVFFTGLISGLKKGSSLFVFLGSLCGAVIVYLFGVPWLKFVLHMPWDKALAAGFFPFIIGDAVKVAAIVPIARWLGPVVDEALKTDPADKNENPGS